MWQPMWIREAWAAAEIKGKPVTVETVNGSRVYMIGDNVDVRLPWVSNLASYRHFRVLFRQSSPRLCQIMPADLGGGVWAMVDGNFGA